VLERLQGKEGDGKECRQAIHTVGVLGKGLSKMKSNTRAMSGKHKALVADVRQQLAEMKNALREQMGLSFIAKLKVFDCLSM